MHSKPWQRHALCTTTRRKPALSVAVAAPAGLLAGTVGALCGVGGGIVMMPVLRQFTTLGTHAITSTSLLAVTVGASASAAAYIHQGVADIGVAAVLAISSMPFTYLGVTAASKLSGNALGKVLAAFLLASAPAVAFKPQLREASARWQASRQASGADRGAGSPHSEGGDVTVTSGIRAVIASMPRSVQPAATYLVDKSGYIAAGCVAGFVSGMVRAVAPKPAHAVPSSPTFTGVCMRRRRALVAASSPQRS